MSVKLEEGHPHHWEKQSDEQENVAVRAESALTSLEREELIQFTSLQ